MQEIITGIIVAVVSAVIISMLKIGNSKTVVAVHGGKRVSSIWKILILLGWLMFVGGLYYGLAWLAAEGFSDYRSGMGISIGMLGFFVLAIGKLGKWWSSN